MGRNIEDVITCDGCGVSAYTDDETKSEVAGWLVDYSANPHSHLCPECQENAVGH